MYGPLNKLCGFECQRANLNFLRPFFVANCDDLLHIIVRYTWLCSSRGILKTNNGREGVKCKLFCPRGFRNRVARPLTTSAKKATHFWHPLYYSGAEKNRRHWPAHLGTWLRQKKVSQDEGQQNGNCEQAATANIIFRLAAVENSHLLRLPSMGRRSTDLEKSKHQTRYGVGKTWPFSFDELWTIPIGANKVAWHFGRTCGWYEVLIVEFSGAVYKSGKNWTAHSIFDTPLGRLPSPAGLEVASLFLSPPGKACALSKSVPN